MPEEYEDAQEPSEDVNDIFPIEEISIGMLVSALIIIPLENGEKVTEKPIKGWPSITWPSYTLDMPGACEIIDIVRDEDNNILLLIKPMETLYGNIEPIMIGKTFLVPLEQINSPDTDDILDVIIQEIAHIKDASLTRQEIIQRLQKILNWVAYEEDEEE